jgi:glutathione S-transferase
MATPILYVCSLDHGGPWFHPCRRVIDALDAAGHSYERVVFDRNRPFGLFTDGKRPRLKQMTGQERLPVLQTGDGTFVNGSREIISWARATPASASAAAG